MWLLISPNHQLRTGSLFAFRFLFLSLNYPSIRHSRRVIFGVPGGRKQTRRHCYGKIIHLYSCSYDPWGGGMRRPRERDTSRSAQKAAAHLEMISCSISTSSRFASLSLVLQLAAALGPPRARGGHTADSPVFHPFRRAVASSKISVN